MLILIRAFLLILILTAPMVARAQSLIPEPVQKPNPEDLKRGAVLCQWQLLMAIRDIGKVCHASEDEEHQKAMDESVRRIEQFIVENGHPSQGYISTWEKNSQEMARSPKFCNNASLDYMYQAFKKKTPAEIKAATDFLLAVPRTPVMNPCF
jgi:hypothetical protein